MLIFEQQIHYFKNKLNIPTDSYLDISGIEHDYFFMVAGANRNEVLLAFRQVVDDALMRGATLEEFRKNFDNIVKSTGWDYNGGRNWRSRIIYDTNLYSAYNRGRLEQQLSLAEELPYWEYIHNDSSHPRPQHQAWHGLVLRYDDPWWKYHYPIKAYGCHCTVVAHDQADLERYHKTIGRSPNIEWQEKTVGVRRGQPQTVTIPKGYDVGFAPNNFEHLTAARDANIDKVLLKKMITADPKFASRAVESLLQQPQARIFHNAHKAWADALASGDKELLKQASNQRLVGVINHQTLTKLDELGLMPQSAVIAMEKGDMIHAVREAKKKAGIDVPLSFWQEITTHLQQPKAILLDKNNKKTLLYIYEIDKLKLAIKLDYKIKIDDLKGGKQRTVVNILRTGSLVKEQEWIEDLPNFQLITGSL